jgi:hypothetical protein
VLLYKVCRRVPKLSDLLLHFSGFEIYSHHRTYLVWWTTISFCEASSSSGFRAPVLSSNCSEFHERISGSRLIVPVHAPEIHSRDQSCYLEQGFGISFFGQRCFTTTFCMLTYVQDIDLSSLPSFYTSNYAVMWYTVDANSGSGK